MYKDFEPRPPLQHPRNRMLVAEGVVPVQQSPQSVPPPVQLPSLNSEPVCDEPVTRSQQQGNLTSEHSTYQILVEDSGHLNDHQIQHNPVKEEVAPTASATEILMYSNPVSITPRIALHSVIPSHSVIPTLSAPSAVSSEGSVMPSSSPVMPVEGGFGADHPGESIHAETRSAAWKAARVRRDRPTNRDCMLLPSITELRMLCHVAIVGTSTDAHGKSVSHTRASKSPVCCPPPPPTSGVISSPRNVSNVVSLNGAFGVCSSDTCSKIC